MDVDARPSGPHPLGEIGLIGGDLCATLGGLGDRARLLTDEAFRAPIDVVRAELDGRPHWFVAHLVARRRWLPIAAALAIATLYATVSTFPPEVAQAAPYVVTIVVLAVSSQRLRPPASAGLPYRSRR